MKVHIETPGREDGKDFVGVGEDLEQWRGCRLGEALHASTPNLGLLFHKYSFATKEVT